MKKVAEEMARELDPAKRQHVIPEDGRNHVRSADCWCNPEQLEDCPLMYVHTPSPVQGGSLLLQ